MTIVDYCGLLWTIVDCHVECMMDSFNTLDAHQFLSPRHVSGHTSNRVQQDQERDPFWLKRRSLRKSTETPFQAPFTFSFKIENKHKQTQNGYRVQLSSKLSNFLLQRNLSSIVRHGWRPKHGCVLSVLGLFWVYTVDVC